jgi:hypothetical protein
MLHLEKTLMKNPYVFEGKEPCRKRFDISTKTLRRFTQNTSTFFKNAAAFFEKPELFLKKAEMNWEYSDFLSELWKI